MVDVKVYAEGLEAEAQKQIDELCLLRPFERQRIRVMPDAHSGIGCVVGLTSTFEEEVIPNIVGVDIACGVSAYLIGKKKIDFQSLDDVIRERIPSGMGWRENEHPIFNLNYDNLACINGLHDLDRIKRSIGTLGGGNHFIEIDEDMEGNLWLVVHSGSRNLGSQVCNYYQNVGYEENFNGSTKSKAYLKEGFIEHLKQDGKQDLISYVLQTMNKIERDNTVDKQLAWVEGKTLEAYLNDCDFCNTYAISNRNAMAQEIFSGMGWSCWDDMISSTHNYVDTANHIIRKGAIAAYEGQKVIIPLNMAAGCVVGIGKGNSEYNWSAPHGAGRKMSRSKAKRTIRVRDYREQMANVWSSCVGSSTLDEAPSAYKDVDYLIESLKDTVNVGQVMRPVYNFKAEEVVAPWAK